MERSCRFPVMFLVIATYLLFGAGYTVLTPQWQNPDEPAHFNYIRQLAETKRLPALEMSDYDQAYLEEIVRRGFPAELAIDPLCYENHQPPLYYLLALPVYSLTENRVLALRLFSLALGSGVIMLTYLAGRTVLPENPPAACTAAAFIALLPQHTAMMASINNDALAELFMALVLWLALRERLHLSTGRTERALLGVVTGLALLAKLTVATPDPACASSAFSFCHCRERSCSVSNH